MFRIGILLGALLSVGTATACRPRESPAKDPNLPTYVLLTHLVGAPAAYHGRLVRVAGYCRVEFEGNSLYVDRPGVDTYGGSKAMWLDLGWPVADDIRALSGQYVVVEATVDALSKGHFGAYRGTLARVRRIEATTIARERESILKAMESPN